MGKREQGKFERVPNDLYRTWDERAVRPLLRVLDPGTAFVEPCAGHGDLVDQLVRAGHRCIAAYDIEPKRHDIGRRDALTLRWPKPGRAIWITNPPWTRDLLHPIIKNLAAQATLWALFDADWMFTDQSSAYLHLLHRVVAVGRVRWIEGSTMDGFDNVAWYEFSALPRNKEIEFIGRAY